MFEQSLLMENGGAKKSGAFAASFTVQSIGVGILILLPFIYREPLPMLQPLTIPLPLPLLPRAPEPVHRDVARQVSHTAMTPAPVFQVPHILRPIAAILSDPPDPMDAPTIGEAPRGSPTGVAGSLLDGYALPAYTPPAPLRRAAESSSKAPPRPLVVGGDVQAAKLIKQVIPQYPPLAKQARVSGTVHLVGIISKDGTIQQLHVESGHPLLIGAALAAVRQWIYRPTLLNGTPVEVIAPIDVIFTLGN